MISTIIYQVLIHAGVHIDAKERHMCDSQGINIYARLLQGNKKRKERDLFEKDI
jgi:hypothetical protein